MAHEFDEFHQELRSVAGDLLAKDRAIDWPVLVEAGWVGLEIPEEFGGAGATFAEVAVVCEEMGRAASTNSYLGSAVLAAGALKALQPSDTRDRLMRDVAAGAVRVAVALEPLEFVPDAEGADRILVIRYGRIAQSGRHAELLRETGLYAFLYARRAGEAASDQEPAVVALGAGTRTHR